MNKQTKLFGLLFRYSEKMDKIGVNSNKCIGVDMNYSVASINFLVQDSYSMFI